jgi:hypothetical protein
VHSQRPVGADQPSSRRDRGITDRTAPVATARKLTVLCWHLIIKGEDYAAGVLAALAAVVLLVTIGYRKVLQVRRDYRARFPS